MNENLPSQTGSSASDVCSMLNIAIMNLSTGLFICDRDGIVVFINKAYAGYLNIEPEQAIGRHITELIPDSRIPHVLQNGEPDIGAIRLISETSSRILTNRYPLFNAQGQLMGAMSMVVLDKPEQIHILQRQIDSLGRKVSRYARRIRTALEARYTLDSLVGSSPAMLAFKQLLLRFARTDGNRAHQRADRHRQGTGGQRHPQRQQPQRRALRQSQLRGHPAGAVLKASCSATRRARFPGRARRARKGRSNWRTRGRSFSMKWGTCRRGRR